MLRWGEGVLEGEGVRVQERPEAEISRGADSDEVGREEEAEGGAADRRQGERHAPGVKENQKVRLFCVRFRNKVHFCRKIILALFF